MHIGSTSKHCILSQILLTSWLCRTEMKLMLRIAESRQERCAFDNYPASPILDQDLFHPCVIAEEEEVLDCESKQAGYTVELQEA